MISCGDYVVNLSAVRMVDKCEMMVMYAREDLSSPTLIPTAMRPVTPPTVA